MSAFICSDLHIATIARAIFSDSPCIAQKLANKLKSINIESVNYRYGEKTRKTKCDIRDFQSFHLDSILRLIECWNYQSCEDGLNLDYIVYSRFLLKWAEQHGAVSGNSDLWSI